MRNTKKERLDSIKMIESDFSRKKFVQGHKKGFVFSAGWKKYTSPLKGVIFTSPQTSIQHWNKAKKKLGKDEEIIGELHKME